MKIKQLTLKNLSIPFKSAFQHASATRLKTEAVIAVVESESGLNGFGEGCPRSYVTGETLKTCHRFFEEHKTEMQQLNGLEPLQNWVAQNRSSIDSNSAAWCSLELALLDLMAKEKQCTVESLLSLPELNGPFEYTAVLGLNSLSAFDRQLKQYLTIGFRDYKIKISGNLDEDLERIERVGTALPTQSKIRLDANNVWSQASDAIQYLERLNLSVFAVEEPIAKNDFIGHRKIFEALGLPIILDESFCNWSQFQELRKKPEGFIINLRISKMGGILRSLNILKEAQQLGIPVIIGAQVGETSLLTRAALTLCNTFRETVIGQEGAFGTHLLEHDITHNPLMFGPRGLLVEGALGQKPGLGVEINPEFICGESQG